jgi:uncharacterized membrane protein YsdA (DUF1294 family)
VSGAIALIVLLAAINATTWAVYRLDKRRARRAARRVPERTLLGLAAAGGIVGALLAVYAHRQRHKARKGRFMAALWSIALAHAVIAAAIGYEALRRS